MELTDLVQCPNTGRRLQFDHTSQIAHVEGSDIAYPIIDQIIDFMPDTLTKVSMSYDKVASRYDAVLTKPELLQRICNRIIWGADDDNAYADIVLSYLPAEFDGVLLDVPVGTGVFTCSVYPRYPNATIICVDCSMGMLRKAGENFRQHGIKNVHLLRADAANLPLCNSAADIVLCMNGWHAFDDKQQSIAQIRRVLRPKRKLIACGYVKGASKRSDFFVKHFGMRNGYFARPLFNQKELPEQFQGFQITRQGSNQSLAYFEAENENPDKRPNRVRIVKA